MATNVENLLARKAAVCAELAALDTTKAGGVPDCSAAGIQHQAYKRGLYDELQILDRLIAAAEGPWEVVTEGEP